METTVSTVALHEIMWTVHVCRFIFFAIVALQRMYFYALLSVYVCFYPDILLFHKALHTTVLKGAIKIKINILIIQCQSACWDPIVSL